MWSICGYGADSINTLSGNDRIDTGYSAQFGESDGSIDTADAGDGEDDCDCGTEDSFSNCERFFAMYPPP